MRGKIYVTDEGFGPIVRQSAIIKEFRELNSDIQFTLQTHRHVKQAQRIIDGIDFIDKYNNISWDKTDEGSPDLKLITERLSKYIEVSDKFIEEDDIDNVDFIITDYVYEAFEIGDKNKIPSFGVSHFTWDWFFSKMYPPVMSEKVLKRFFDYAEKAEVLYFPPFTPREILNHYKHKAKEVPLIVRTNVSGAVLEDSDEFKIMIIDSGTGVLSKQIKKAIEKIHLLKEVKFYISSAYDCEAENVGFIDENRLFVDYIPQMDLVIGRAGFNTISECIAFRTPMLLLSGEMNPELHENMMNIKNLGLGSFISIDQFTNKLHEMLPGFLGSEYEAIKQNMSSHNLRIDGAKVIASDIMDRIS